VASSDCDARRSKWNAFGAPFTLVDGNVRAGVYRSAEEASVIPSCVETDTLAKQGSISFLKKRQKTFAR
jgi:hypothetical protein